MKKLNLTFLFFLTVFFLSAQDITITFQSKVDTVSIDSIRATNLRTNQTVKLLGGESLLLVKTSTGINPVLEIIETGYIYPNPSNEDAEICFSTNKSEEVEIRMYNINGQLLKHNRLFLEQGTHRFELKFPVDGIYFLSVLKSEGTASFKAVSVGNKTQITSIEYVGSEINHINIDNQKATKSTSLYKNLVFEPGDNIHYTVYSDKNSTLISDEPIMSKTIEVEFYACIDPDGKTYKTVQIGTQVWMAENLAYLPSVSPSDAWSETTKIYYVYGYEGSSVAAAKAIANYSTYGVLYNWAAAMNGEASIGIDPSGVQGVCPSGWYLPSNREWTTLKNYLADNGYNYDGTTGGYPLNKVAKALAANTYWNTNDVNGVPGSNMSANNSSGFSALPGGERHISSSNFEDVRDAANWWSCSEQSFLRDAIFIRLTKNGYGTSVGYSLESHGYSVRCVREHNSLSVKTNPEPNLKDVSATLNGNATSDNGSSIIERGFYWSSTISNPGPLTGGTKVTVSGTTGSYNYILQELQPNKYYYYTAYAINDEVVATGKSVTFRTKYGSITDSRDGRIYYTVKIGTQEWLAENMAYLPYLSSVSASSRTENAYYVYGYTGNDITEAKANKNYITYGVLYNLYAAPSACPSGWHLPSKGEWDALSSALGSNGGGKMKSTTFWNSPNIGATNSSGFSALPGGELDCNNKEFVYIGVYGYWWSSSSSYMNNAYHYAENPIWSSGCGTSGMSVRCVRDDITQLGIPYINTTAITDITQTTATGGGNVVTDGGATVTSRGICWNTTGNPTTDNSKTSNGTDKGKFTSSLTGLAANTPYYVRAYATNSEGTAYGNEVTFTTSSYNLTGTFSDTRDGHVYKTVKIGEQVWMAENLAFLPAVHPPTSGSSTEPRYNIYGYSGSDIATAKQNANYSIYGVLYNWLAALKACPPGWHLPSDGEWTTLTTLLGGEEAAGDKMKATSGWYNNGNGINTSDFSVLPGGLLYWNGFDKIGYKGYWWSSKEYDTYNAWRRSLEYEYKYVFRNNSDKVCGYSVRCVRD